MLAIARGRGAEVPTLREWKRVAPIGVLLFVGGNGLVSIASQSIHSSGTAVVCAMMPLWVGVLGTFVGEKSSVREWVALVLGFVGVVVLMGGPSLDGKPAHVVAILIAPITWAAGSLLARRTKDVGGAHAALVGPALQMICGGLALACVAIVRGERIPVDAGAHGWLALGYLWTAGSLIAFTAYAWLLRNARPVVATSYAYVNPVIAVVIGTVLYGEPVGWTTVVANVLVVAAVMLALAPRGGGRRRV
jgi:drug/metabolite transporter (DMT)-like permease